MILLMAMLGAVVLARKQVEIDEDAKARARRDASGREEGGRDARALAQADARRLMGS